MSKYDALWAHFKGEEKEKLTLTFDEIGRIAGVPIDHSFLNAKKELLPYGYRVDKISLKAQTVSFCKAEGQREEEI